MRKVFEVLTGLAFLLLLGSVGALEEGTISIAMFAVQGSAGFIMMVIFWKLACVYERREFDEEARKIRQRWN
jgi:hypothetical protein